MMNFECGNLKIVFDKPI